MFVAMSKDPQMSTAFYQAILELGSPWVVRSVELDKDAGEVEIVVEAVHEGQLPCVECGKPSPVHDRRRRRWRHLDTCQHQTILVAAIPRVRCVAHGVHQVHVPWAEPGSRFTALLESVVIDWLLEASISAVAEQFELTWDQVAGIQARAVARGLARRELVPPVRMAVDETSFQKRHEYVTVVTDLLSDCVVYVADDRRKESLQGFFDLFEPVDLMRIEAVSMDMWPAYISVIEKNVDHADEKICFDKFHVAKYLGGAVDKVRRTEHREMMAEGDRSLVGSKYAFLRNPENMTTAQASFLERVKRLALRTARAWALKEHAMCLWHYVSRGWARRAWKAWISWALRSRLEPVKAVARLVQRHLEGIINAIVLRATNAGAESINARIQKVKRMANGYRNRERFRNAIYFHLGNLQLHP
jgi:transposase